MEENNLTHELGTGLNKRTPHRIEDKNYFKKQYKYLNVTNDVTRKYGETLVVFAKQIDNLQQNINELGFGVKMVKNIVNRIRYSDVRYNAIKEMLIKKLDGLIGYINMAKGKKDDHILSAKSREELEKYKKNISSLFTLQAVNSSLFKHIETVTNCIFTLDDMRKEILQNITYYNFKLNIKPQTNDNISIVNDEGEYDSKVYQKLYRKIMSGEMTLIKAISKMLRKDRYKKVVLKYRMTCNDIEHSIEMMNYTSINIAREINNVVVILNSLTNYNDKILLDLSDSNIIDITKSDLDRLKIFLDLSNKNFIDQIDFLCFESYETVLRVDKLYRNQYAYDENMTKTITARTDIKSLMSNYDRLKKAYEKTVNFLSNNLLFLDKVEENKPVYNLIDPSTGKKMTEKENYYTFNNPTLKNKIKEHMDENGKMNESFYNDKLLQPFIYSPGFRGNPKMIKYFKKNYHNALAHHNYNPEKDLGLVEGKLNVDENKYVDVGPYKVWIGLDGQVEYTDPDDGKTYSINDPNVKLLNKAEFQRYLDNRDKMTGIIATKTPLTNHYN